MPRRRWGQHFLRDDATARRLVKAAGVAPEDTVLEIGPGTGRLTRALLERASRVIAVEIDAELAARLPDAVGRDDRLTVIQADAAATDLEGLLQELLRTGATALCVANLPYETATPILAGLLRARHRLRGISLVVQREVAERLAASPGSRAYGYLSVCTQDVAAVRVGLRLRPGAFRPPPRVESAQVHLTPRRAPRRGDLDGPGFRRFVAALFTSRRKTLANNLRHRTGLDGAAVGALLAAAGIDGAARPETLDVAAFAALYRAAAAGGVRIPGAAADPV
ncbi:MAG: 16S rRNA (adenine(1518)-N(6)/adenine(1519)-N(6))-dimethyltransferase RsmA [Acidobacteriota bacterium]|jgi:16S rRNA (adenine1518-N6/adenine1519-N6)-dimethyltransferase